MLQADPAGESHHSSRMRKRGDIVLRLDTANHCVLSDTEIGIEEFECDRIGLWRLWQVGVETVPSLSVCGSTASLLEERVTVFRANKNVSKE